MRAKLKHVCFLGLLVILCLFASAAFAVEELEVRVTGIRVHQDALTLPLGETALVKATVYPADAANREIYWEVSDPRIIAVTEEGLSVWVNALSPGAATLTAFTRDGGFYDSCSVTAIVLVRTLSLEQSEMNLAVGEEFQFSPIIEPPDATDQRLEWESTEPVVASVNEEGKVTALKEGETRVVARSMQDETITAYVNVTVSSPASIGEGAEGPRTEPPPAAPSGGKVKIKWLLIGGLPALLLAAALAMFFSLRSKKTRERPRPVLRGLTGYFAGQTMELSGGPLVIGRDPTLARLLYPPEYGEISRKHCSVRFDSYSGQFILEDYSSLGTFLDSDEKLAPGSPRRLAPGSRFYLSDTGELFSVELA